MKAKVFVVWTNPGKWSDDGDNKAETDFFKMKDKKEKVIMKWTAETKRGSARSCSSRTLAIDHCHYYYDSWLCLACERKCRQIKVTFFFVFFKFNVVWIIVRVNNGKIEKTTFKVNRASVFGWVVFFFVAVLQCSR